VKEAAGVGKHHRQQLMSGWPVGLHHRFGGGRSWQQQSPLQREREEF
jgi:hypothetical protein